MTAVVFDLDGTLVNSAPDVRAIANIVLESERAAPLTLAETRNFIGNGARVFVERMAEERNVPATPDRLAAMCSRFEKLYLTATTLSRLYPGVHELLFLLKRDGHALGICTNKPIAPTRHVLDHFGIAGMFDAILGGDSLPERKPDPTPLLRVFDRLGAGQGQRLFVGDSEVDAETAGQAGVPFALFTEGYRKSPVEALKHDFSFDHFDQLPAYVADRFA